VTSALSIQNAKENKKKCVGHRQEAPKSLKKYDTKKSRWLSITSELHALLWGGNRNAG